MRDPWFHMALWFMMRFRTVKDAIALPLHRFGHLLAGAPRSLSRAIISPLGAAAKAAYFVPGHLSGTVGNFCRVTDRTDPWPIYSRMVDNVLSAALHFARLHRHGRSGLLAQTTIAPAVAAELQRLRQDGKGAIIVVPHCVGAVLSSAKLNTACPAVLLVKEPRNPGRCELMLKYVRELGPEYILARRTPPATVMRQIVRALHDGKVVVGTTDLVNAGDDSVETQMFGQRIFSPGWPARLSARFNVPILPGYIHMDGHQIVLLGDESFLEGDIDRGTQRWASSFEKHFRQYPSDWAFMLDKNWARVLANAANSVTTTPPFRTNILRSERARQR
jgi:lauroyl/myristoyl acyltransferase